MVAAARSSHETLSAPLLAWYDRHARLLPWRARPGAPAADPYHVWLSEIMLQQTTVATVGPYFERFLAVWPTVEALAEAPQEAVLTAWAGLGYYARARNLHRCAQTVVKDHGGRFPDREEALLKLPGVGPYTAAAIAAIAFDRKATVVDGNVERVVARLFAVKSPLPAAKPELKYRAAEITPEARPGDFAQAMMDLGATVCLPRNPKCGRCPLRDFCRAWAEGCAEELPRRAPKKAKPTRRAVAFFVTRPDGAILLRRRPEKGLLGGMMEVPTTDWRETDWTADEARRQAPIGVDWSPLLGTVRHTFTHFHFEITVWKGQAPAEGGNERDRWVLPDQLGDQALPTVMRKILRHGLEALPLS